MSCAACSPPSNKNDSSSTTRWPGSRFPPPVRVPVPLPSDRLRGLLDEVDGPRARLLLALVAIHGLRPFEVTHLRLSDLDHTRLIIRVPRRGSIHTVYLDQLSVDLLDAWLTERHRQWPDTTNPHLFVTSHSARHPAQPPLSYCGLRAAFDQVGLIPKQLWRDRVLHEAQHTADPVHLIRLFGIHPSTAVKYGNAAHLDKALPRVR